MIAPRLTTSAASVGGGNWMTDVYCRNPKIKIIRSAKRNALTEQIQEVTTLDNPILNGELRSGYPRVINSAARTFRYYAQLPDTLFTQQAYSAGFFPPLIVTTNGHTYDSLPGSKYASGRLGIYRLEDEYTYHKDRSYNNYVADRQRGTYEIPNGQMGWAFGIVPAYNPDHWESSREYYNSMVQNFSNSTWIDKFKVGAYTIFGRMGVAKDATQNKLIHGWMTDCDNRTVIADVYGAGENWTMYENFENFLDLFRVQANRFIFFPNTLRKYIRNHVSSTTLVGANMSLVKLNSSTGKAHTGIYALDVHTPPTTGIPIQAWWDYGNYNALGKIIPFHFRSGTKYIFSVWQKVNPNQPMPDHSAVNFTLNTTQPIVCSLKAKTPVIDGWVLYEGNMHVPAQLGINHDVLIGFTDPCIIDDIRIIPAHANMKAYVYHPFNKRLVAILDENHFATMYEYNNEGKLARVKKETEKGILTLKESRQAVRSTISNAQVGGTISHSDLYTGSGEN